MSEGEQEQQDGAADVVEVVETNPFRRESFMAGDVRVVGDEEQRWPEDLDDPHKAGAIKEPASVSLVFAQTAMIPGLMPAPDGQGIALAMSALHLGEYIARGIEPDAAIAVGEYLVEEGKRVKATMRHPDGDPEHKARQSGLIVAGAGSERAAADALDPSAIANQHAGNGGQKQ